MRKDKVLHDTYIVRTNLPWLLAGYALVLVILGLDQWTKALVLAEPAFNALGCLPIELKHTCGRVPVPGPMDLSMVWNRGISFGAFQSEGLARWVLFGVSGVIAVVFAVWMTRAGRLLTLLALALVVGGAIGNMIDRARFGAVVDFIDFSDLWFIWVFNIADSAITVGAVLLFLDQFLLSRRQAAWHDADGGPDSQGPGPSDTGHQAP